MRRAKLVRVALPLLAGLAVIAALAINASYVSSSAPRAQGGVLDLSGWSRDKDSVFELTGEWEFYWDRLLDEPRMKGGAEPFSIVGVPGEWNYYETDGGSLPGKGKATYRVRVTGGETGAQYGVRIQNMAGAYRLYAGNRLIAQNGSFGDSADAPAAAYRPQLASFVAESGSFDIILQVSNDAYAVGGMWEPIIFGTYERISAFDRVISSIGMFSFGSLAVMCLFFMVFFTVHRGEKDMLILAGIGAMVIVRLTVYGDAAVTYLFPHMPISGFGRIDYLTLLWVQFLLLYFVYCAYAGLVRRWQVTALLAYSVCISPFVMLLPFEIVASAYQIMNFILLFVIAAVVVHLARAAYGGRTGAPALLGAMGLVLFLILYEMFAGDRSLSYYLLTNGAFDYMVLFFVQCVIVAQRYNRAQQMEVALLKSQIHPHFVHNSLTTIISVSRKDAERSRELLMDFSSYLRGFYNYEGDELIPIDQELELIRAYAALEQARFGERLRVEYRIEADNILLPPLILQPLVENAFVHGLREKEDGGTVVVYASKTKRGTVRVGVRDDGVGMRAKSKEPERPGVGIENINRRLARLYRAQLVFSIPEGGGCDVYMEIPCKEAQSVESNHH